VTERTPDEFPVPNEDGILEIEVTRYWQCDDECVTSNLRDIIEYICVLADGSGNDHKGALEVLRTQYEEAGLTPPKDFYLYVVDIDGHRHPYEYGGFIAPEKQYSYEDDSYKKVFSVWSIGNEKVRDYIRNELGVSIGEATYAYADLTTEQFMKLRAAFPDFIMERAGLPLGELAVLTHGAGVACNDLTGDNLKEAIDFLDSDSEEYWYPDLFKYRLTLNFWHS
jgi:hypothetical protein